MGPTVWELEGPMPILKMSKMLIMMCFPSMLAVCVAECGCWLLVGLSDCVAWIKARFHASESLRILAFFVGRMMRGLPSQKYTALSCFAGRADSGADGL